MKQVSLRQFSNQPSKWIKELPIILTSYNIPVASVIPYKGYKGIRLQKEVDEVSIKYLTNSRMQDLTPEPHTPMPPLEHAVTTVSVARCEAPNTPCRGEGMQYKIGFMTDEGVKKKDLYLCATHLQKARAECESVETV